MQCGLVLGPVCAENSNPDVLMVKTTENRPRFNGTDGLNLLMYRGILV